MIGRMEDDGRGGWGPDGQQWALMQSVSNTPISSPVRTWRILMSSEDTSKGSNSGGSSRTRVIVARVLTVVAVLLLLVGALAFYVENTALDRKGSRRSRGK